jgi:superfamily II RNA helicase
MLESKGQPLESKLNLSYKLILNVVKSEQENITDILNKSFYENENEKGRIQASKDATQL